MYCDRSARKLPELTPGQRVTIQDQATLKWKPAELKEKLAEAPRSYAVTTPTGRELRRNRIHIRAAPQDNKEVEPDTDGQIVAQATRQPNRCGFISPREPSVRTPEQLCN